MSYRSTYKFTRFRSQLEVNFAKELDRREIRWFYEPERLGTHRYLLDFFLPQYKAWVECKGKVSTRDYDALLALSVLLKQERRQRVFMYTAELAYLITDSGYETLTHAAFWERLADLPAEGTPPPHEGLIPVRRS